MRVGQRLFLAVVPAILGLFAVAALAYWGQIDRSAPPWLVIVAAVAALLSLAVAWQNTRYVARRIERLAGAKDIASAGTLSPLTVVRNAALPGAGSSPDEIDSIEGVVDRLSGAVAVAETSRREREAAATGRVQEYAALLAEATSAVARQLDEVRLPLHILLENHFGQLNENQEEMLAGARAAAEGAGVELARLREIAELDRGALSFRRDRVRIGGLLQALKPQLVADGERADVKVTIDCLPGLPPVAGDRVRLQEALDLLLRHLVRHALPGSEVTISATRHKGEVAIEVVHGPAPMLDANVALAQRIILAHGGRIEDQDGRMKIFLPVTGFTPAAISGS
jgi:signal transduction histidine kinase